MGSEKIVFYFNYIWVNLKTTVVIIEYSKIKDNVRLGYSTLAFYSDRLEFKPLI